MNRLLSLARCDVRLQVRQGFYIAGAFVAVVWIVILTQIPFADLGRVMPAFLFLNLMVTTFYFVAGLVLYEKEEGTLEALVVTPLRVGEYLFSKTLTLTLLAAAESLAILLFAYGLDCAWLPLLLGVASTAALYTLFGIIAVVRYDSINQFLIPSSLVVALLQLPIVDSIGLWQSWVLWLWPTRATLLLLEAAFRPVAAWEGAYALLYAALWLVLLSRAARGAFRRFVIRKEGVR